jgi:hypothetical protein
MSVLEARRTAHVGGAYARIDAISEEYLRSPAAFSSLIAAEPRIVPTDRWDGMQRNYALLRTWQKSCLRLLVASIRGELPRVIAAAVLDHLPEHFGWRHHGGVLLDAVEPPVFFRTDQAADGTVLEVQCPGSVWGMHEIAHVYYADAGSIDAERHPPLASRFGECLTARLGAFPVVHHLLDNSSHPAGERFFIQRVRPRAAYVGFDKNVRPQDCNFVRGHDFFCLLTENFAAERLGRLAEGRRLYDLPPVAFFDQKLLLAFPFWAETREHFSDAVRGLFPYTAMLTPAGMGLPEGDWVTLEQFAARPRGGRRFFLKYAGADVARNWGSRAVFRLDTLTSDACLARLREAVARYAGGERWILQPECASDEQVSFVSREGEIERTTARSKHSVLYGPSGAMGLGIMFEHHFKVHMSPETIFTIGLRAGGDPRPPG